MHLLYFDENKYSVETPHFFLGGILLQDSKLIALENSIMELQSNFFGKNTLSKETELHGIDLFQGKRSCKNTKLETRVKLILEITTLLVAHLIPIRLVCINVDAHRKKYVTPQAEYNLGLMFLLERFCDYLDKVEDIGIVFGDHEKDEVTRSILDFSQFKANGKTHMHFGRPLGRLIDTIYFTHSHHSRFLQIADIVVYLANRLENRSNTLEKWHESELQKAWSNLKQKTDFYIQRWPV